MTVLRRLALDMGLDPVGSRGELHRRINAHLVQPTKRPTRKRSLSEEVELLEPAKRRALSLAEVLAAARYMNTAELLDACQQPPWNEYSKHEEFWLALLGSRGWATAEECARMQYWEDLQSYCTENVDFLPSTTALSEIAALLVSSGSVQYASEDAFVAAQSAIPDARSWYMQQLAQTE